MSDQLNVETPKRCHKLVNVTTDAKVEAEFPNMFRYVWRTLTPEERARALEKACEEFAEFIRDHRSQDPVELTVVRIKEDICSHCGRAWEMAEEGGKVYCASCGSEVEEQGVPKK